jgi:hypothetical protein
MDTNQTVAIICNECFIKAAVNFFACLSVCENEEPRLPRHRWRATDASQAARALGPVSSSHTRTQIETE